MANRTPQFSVPIPVPGLPPIPVHVPGTGGNDHGVHIPNPAHVVNDVGNIASGTAHFFEALVDPHTWVRVGEVLVGTILLVVGIDHLFNTDFTNKMARVMPYMMV